MVSVEQVMGTRAMRDKMCLLMLAAGLLALQGLAASAPDWYGAPPADDVDFLYETGYAEKQDSRLAALDAALQEALTRLTRRISITVRDETELKVSETLRSKRNRKDKADFEESFTRNMQTIANHQLIGTDIVHEEYRERRGKWEAWIVASYPVPQYKKALARVPDLVAESLRGPKAEKVDPRIPLLVCPLAFGEQSVEQFPELVARFKSKGYGNAIWQTVEDKLYDTQRFLFVTPPQAQMQSMLESILGRTPEVKQRKLPRRILLCNMNFFEAKTESLRFGAAARRTDYHVELMFEYYNLEDAYSNIKIPAKGEARNADLLVATNEAATLAIKKLLDRIDKEGG